MHNCVSAECYLTSIISLAYILNHAKHVHKKSASPIEEALFLWTVLGILQKRSLG